MSDPIFFAPMMTPMVNPETGIVSRQWYLLFQAMFQRLGGSDGSGINDLQQVPVSAVQALDIGTLTQSSQDYLAEIRYLRDQVGELTKRLDDIAQGTQL